MHAPGLSLSSLRALGRALGAPSAWAGHHIGARLRELIILHVSSINGCPICCAMHAELAISFGVEDPELHAALACDPEAAALDARTRVALRYTELRTRGCEGDDPVAVERFASSFSPAQQREIRLITDLFTFATRFNNSWERWVPGATTRRARMGLCEAECYGAGPPVPGGPPVRCARCSQPAS